MLRNLEINVAWRTARHHMKRHIRLFGSAITLLDVAFEASGDDVIPAVGTTLGARHDVVDGQIMPTVAAILAGVIVTMEEVSS